MVYIMKLMFFLLSSLAFAEPKFRYIDTEHKQDKGAQDQAPQRPAYYDKYKEKKVAEEAEEKKKTDDKQKSQPPQTAQSAGSQLTPPSSGSGTPPPAATPSESSKAAVTPPASTNSFPMAQPFKNPTYNQPSK